VERDRADARCHLQRHAPRCATRLRDALRAFFKSEVDEAPLRRALGEAAPLYADTPEADEQRKRSMPILLALLDEAAPGISVRRRSFAAELYVASTASLGKHVSETPRTAAEVDAWAAATADIFLASGALRRIGKLVGIDLQGPPTSKASRSATTRAFARS
jgi:hypothetical protein